METTAPPPLQFAKKQKCPLPHRAPATHPLSEGHCAPHARARVAQPCGGYYWAIKKERSSDTCHNTDIMLSPISQSQRDKRCMILLT